MGKVKKVPLKPSSSSEKIGKSKIQKTYKSTDAKKIKRAAEILKNEKTELVLSKPKKPRTIKSSFLDKKQVANGVDALTQLTEKKGEGVKLFDEGQAVFLQIMCIKVPKCPNRILKLPLEHPLIGENAEVCLIVPDLTGEDHKDYDKATEHYETLLKRNGITNVKTILTLHQLLNEYDQYEMKRRLVELYDLFLVDGKISGKVTHVVGKIFVKRRKMPVCVKLNCADLKQNFANALVKVNMHIHSKGDNFIVQVGHTKMEQEHIVENVFSVVDKLQTVFPGGLANMRALHIKTPATTSVPIFYSLKHNKDVLVPVVRSKRPKAFKEHTGELTTKNQFSVVVTPFGKVSSSKMIKENSMNVQNGYEKPVRVKKSQKENGENTKKVKVDKAGKVKMDKKLKKTQKVKLDEAQDIKANKIQKSVSKSKDADLKSKKVPKTKREIIEKTKEEKIARVKKDKLPKAQKANESKSTSGKTKKTKKVKTIT